MLKEPLISSQVVEVTTIEASLCCLIQSFQGAGRWVVCCQKGMKLETFTDDRNISLIWVWIPRLSLFLVCCQWTKWGYLYSRWMCSVACVMVNWSSSRNNHMYLGNSFTILFFLNYADDHHFLFCSLLWFICFFGLSLANVPWAF